MTKSRWAVCCKDGTILVFWGDIPRRWKGDWSTNRGCHAYESMHLWPEQQEALFGRCLQPTDRPLLLPELPDA
jgi:hypothetical protein